MPQTVIDLLQKGIEANNADIFRHDNVIHLPGDGDLVITGDLHGHCRNFERIVTFSDLPHNPNRHVILQEIIHGGPEDPCGGCLSYRLLLDVVRYKLKYPDNVHLVMGNHDTAFINNSEVMKNGKEMNRAMHLALENEFSGAGADVELAFRQFLFSQPLGIRCENRIWISHSLPDCRMMNRFDPKIMNRQLKINDVVRPGSAYLLTWGRRHTQDLLDELGEAFDVDTFILGHQPQEKGWCCIGKNLIILASDHDHGCIICCELAKSYTIEQIIELIVPLASIS